MSLLDAKAVTQATRPNRYQPEVNFELGGPISGRVASGRFADYLPARSPATGPERRDTLLSAAKKLAAIQRPKNSAYSAAQPAGSKPASPEADDLPSRRAESSPARSQPAGKSAIVLSQRREERLISKDARKAAPTSAPASQESSSGQKSEGQAGKELVEAELNPPTEKAASLPEAAVTAPQASSALTQGRLALLELVENLREFSESHENNAFVTSSDDGETETPGTGVGLELGSTVNRPTDALPLAAFLGKAVSETLSAGSLALLAEADITTSSPLEVPSVGTEAEKESAQLGTSLLVARRAFSLERLSEGDLSKSLQEKDLELQSRKEEVAAPAATLTWAAGVDSTPGVESLAPADSTASRAATEGTPTPEVATRHSTAQPQISSHRLAPSAGNPPNLPHEVLATQLQAGGDTSDVAVLDLKTGGGLARGDFSTGNPQGRLDLPKSAITQTARVALQQPLAGYGTIVAEQPGKAKPEGFGALESPGPAETASERIAPGAQTSSRGFDSRKDSGPQAGESDKPARASQNELPFRSSQGPWLGAGTGTQGAAECGPAVSVEGASASRTAERAQAVERLVDLASLQKKADVHQLDLLLHDDRVGRVSLRLTERAGLVDAMLRTDSVRGREMLVESLPSLLDALARRGLEPPLAGSNDGQARNGGEAFEQPGGRSRNPRQQQRRQREARQPEQVFQVEME